MTKVALSKVYTLLLLSFLSSSFACSQALASQIDYDDSGMPRCIEGGAGDSKGLVLYLSPGDRYARDTYAIRLDSQLAQQLHTQEIDCSQWQRVASLPYSLALGGTQLTDNTTSVGEYSFDAQTQLALHEARVGANEFHAEKAGKDYLAQHPIQSFTVEMDRDLTARFGAGFAADVYRAWILSNPTNAAFAQKVLNRMKDPAAASSEDVLRGEFGNRVVLFVQGLGHELKSAQRFAVLQEQLGAMNIPAVLVDTPSFAPIRDNAEIIRGKLQELLAQGKNVILISLSKGTPESLYAVSRLKSQIDSRPQGYGRLEAFVSLSGVYSPSFLIDWAGRMPQWLMTEHELDGEFKDAGLPVPDISGLKDLSVAPMNQIRSEILANGIPQSPIYINLVGTLTGDGIAKDPAVSAIQNDVVRKIPTIGEYGANDGYIEYPGTEIPANWVTQRYVLPIRSSHSIIDGSLAGQSLGSSDGARSLLRALLNEIIEIDGAH